MSSRIAAPSFDDQYLAADGRDPWKYASSDYERRKYERTLAAIPDGHIGRAFEAGCSIGVFTARLADRCGELIAADFSVPALAEARRRTAGLENVTVLERDLPGQMPDGPFDLVVCSDVLYYWTRDLVLDFLRRVENDVSPGGSLLVVDWRGDDPDAPLDGAAVHALIGDETTLAHAHSEAHPGYLIDRWDAA